MASPADRWASPRFDDELYQRCVEALERNPVLRMLAERARAAGVPYRVAVQLWAHPLDLHVEFGLDTVRAKEQQRACPRCGAIEEHYTDPKGRPLEHGYYQIEITGCSVCDHVDREMKRVPEDYRNSAIPRVRPRPKGAPRIKGYTP